MIEKLALKMEKLGPMTSRHVSVFIATSVIVSIGCIQFISSAQNVEFFPISRWNCSGDEAVKICAVDAASETVETSSLTECSMRCWMKTGQCLQFNYYTSVTSPMTKCALYNFRPKNYVISADCQHYVVGAQMRSI